MKAVLVFLAVVFVAGCGIETAGTAATVAAAQKKEIEQAQAAMAKIPQDLEAANQQVAQRAAQAEDATK